MDCQTALHILMEEPFAEYSDEEWEAAGEHMEACSHCHAIFHHGTALDQRIAEVMVQVAPPVTLRHQLLEQLAVSTPAESEPEVSPEIPAPVTTSRPPRSWNRVAVAIAGCLLLGGLFWLFQPQTPQAELYTIRQLGEAAIQQEWSGFPEFENSFSLESSTTLFQWKRISQLHFDPAPRGYRPAGKEQQLMALFRFELPTRTTPANGLLLIVPASQLKQAPSETMLTTHTQEYLEGPSGNYASVSWVEGELAYICLIELVPGGGDELEQLQQLIYGQRA